MGLFFFIITYPKNNHYDQKKEITCRAQRLDYRNALIRALFFHLTANEKHSFWDAYVFLEKIFGIDERQIRKIVRSPQKVELSSDDLTKLAVTLHSLTLRLVTTRGTAAQ